MSLPTNLPWARCDYEPPDKESWDIPLAEPKLDGGPTAVTASLEIDKRLERIIKGRSKMSVADIEALALVQRLITTDLGTMSKAEIKRRFGAPLEKLMDRPEVQKELNRLISSYGLSRNERLQLAKALTNQAALDPESMKDAKTQLAALKLIIEQEGAVLERETPTVSLNLSLAPPPMPAALPQAEVLEVKDLTPVEPVKGS